jgi:hypothetical protein
MLHASFIESESYSVCNVSVYNKWAPVCKQLHML